MKSNRLILISIILFLFSCKRNEEVIRTYPNYSQLKVGNYWIYKDFEIDEFGNERELNRYDSCYIEKDTILNNMTYYKSIRPTFGYPGIYDYTFLRDSLDCIVNSNGQIIFSSENTTLLFSNYYISYNINDTIIDTICNIKWKMEENSSTVNTPSGVYNILNSKQTYLLYPNWSQAGSPRYINTKYTLNIGIVTETFPFFVSNPSFIERRLLRYKVN